MDNWGIWMKKFTIFLISTFLLNLIGCDSPVTDIQSELQINEETPIEETTEEELTVIFIDSDTVISSVIINHGDIIDRPEDPEKDGYRFIDWYADSELSTLFDFSKPVLNNIVIYADYLEKGPLRFYWGQLVAWAGKGNQYQIMQDELEQRIDELRYKPATVKEDQFIDDWYQSGFIVFITPQEFGPIRGIEDMNARELFKQECILDMDVPHGKAGFRTAMEIVIDGNEYYAYIMGLGSNMTTSYNHLAIRY